MSHQWSAPADRHAQRGRVGRGGRESNVIPRPSLILSLLPRLLALVLLARELAGAIWRPRV